MPAFVHVIDVGQGSMALIRAGSYHIVCDCNIRDDNQTRVLSEVRRLLPADRPVLDAFINTHRDKDHLTGIDCLHAAFPIARVWDSGAAGSTITSPEYETYMRVRRSVNEQGTLPTGHTIPLGPLTTLQVLHSATEARPDDANREGVVFKLEHGGNSVLFPGDCDVVTWKRIVSTNPSAMRSDVFIAPHHGASSSLEDGPDMPAAGATIAALLGVYGTLPPSSPYATPRAVGAPSFAGLLSGLAPAPTIATPHYTAHLSLIRPALTVISVGRNNQHGHPRAEALSTYERYTQGFQRALQPGQLVKVVRTDQIGSIWIQLPDAPAPWWVWHG